MSVCTSTTLRWNECPFCCSREGASRFKNLSSHCWNYPQIPSFGSHHNRTSFILQVCAKCFSTSRFSFLFYILYLICGACIQCVKFACFNQPLSCESVPACDPWYCFFHEPHPNSIPHQPQLSVLYMTPWWSIRVMPYLIDVPKIHYRNRPRYWLTPPVIVVAEAVVDIPFVAVPEHQMLLHCCYCFYCRAIHHQHSSSCLFRCLASVVVVVMVVTCTDTLDKYSSVLLILQ